MKGVGRFVGRKGQGSARHLGKKFHSSTQHYEKCPVMLCSCAGRLRGDWRGVECMQLQRKSMDSLLRGH